MRISLGDSSFDDRHIQYSIRPGIDNVRFSTSRSVNEAPRTEWVVLLDEAGKPAGQADKALVHGSDTPLHLAFSCYVFDLTGRVLMTRRALGKKTWPGVWTNSCCGHPEPGEDSARAVHRRVRDELGLEIEDLRLELPEFRYRAVDAGGVVENELCPVYRAVTSETPAPEPSEIMDWTWASWAAVVQLASSTPWALSPWAVLQISELARRWSE